MATKKRRPDGLFKRPGSRYWQCWIKGERRSTGCTDAKAAAAQRAIWERATVDVRLTAAIECNLGGAAEDFIEHIKVSENKPASTVSFYRSKCDSLLRYFGNIRLHDLGSAPVWDAFVEARLAAGMSRNTVAHELTAARRVLKLAKRAGAWPFDIAEVFPDRFSRQYEPKTRSLTVEEIPLLLAAMLKPRLAGFVAWNIGTASRKSEVESAEASDHLGDGLVRVRGTKTAGADDIVPIAPIFRPLIEYAKDRGAATGPMFGAWQNASRDLETACRRAGIPRCTTNDLRRTHSTLLREHGQDTGLIARVLRHSSTRMAEMVYAKMGPEAGRHLLESNQPETTQSLLPTGKKNSDQPFSRCPGTESNCRHEDFQSLSGACDTRNHWGLRPKSALNIAGYRPETAQPQDLDWARQLVAKCSTIETQDGPWLLSRVGGAS